MFFRLLSLCMIAVALKVPAVSIYCTGLFLILSLGAVRKNTICFPGDVAVLECISRFRAISKYNP